MENNCVISNTRSIPYRVSDSQVQTLLSSIETNTDIYKRSLDRALDSSRLNGTNSEDTVNNYITEFENSTDQLKQKFDAKKSVSSDVQEVLNKAYFIDGFMKDNRLNARTQRDWTSLKSKLDTLSNYYNVSWNWTAPTTTFREITQAELIMFRIKLLEELYPVSSQEQTFSNAN